MANPIFIPIAFAANGIKNLIQKVRQTGQDPEDFTWDEGAPLITMTKIEDGGKAPKGQDVNGVLNALSEHVIYGQNGNRYKWSADVVTNFGGYAKNSIVQSADGLREYISLIDNNATNPDSNVIGAWSIYAGQGSVPIASSTNAGVMKVLNIVTSTDIASALSANMGKYLKDLIDTKLDITRAFGVGQTWQDVLASRSKNVTYTNTTGRPIEVAVNATYQDDDGGLNAFVGSIRVGRLYGQAPSGSGFWSGTLTFTVPHLSTYRIEGGSTVFEWAELR